MSQYPNSYYATSLSQQKDALPTLIDDHECDLCVIGGGFSGLSTAIEAAERGLKVILLEQNIIGWGCQNERSVELHLARLAFQISQHLCHDLYIALVHHTGPNKAQIYLFVCTVIGNGPYCIVSVTF